MSLKPLSTAVNNPEQAFRYIRFLESRDVEEFWTIALSPKGKLLCVKMLFRGSRDQCHVDLRELLKTLVVSNATRFIVAHNHPSGDASPSEEDLRLTREITKASKLLGFDFDDHIIVARKEYWSLKMTHEKYFY